MRNTFKTIVIALIVSIVTSFLTFLIVDYVSYERDMDLLMKTTEYDNEILKIIGDHLEFHLNEIINE